MENSLKTNIQSFLIKSRMKRELIEDYKMKHKKELLRFKSIINKNKRNFDLDPYGEENWGV